MTEQDKADLVPCPFCGGDDLMLFCDPEEGMDNSGPSRRIQCSECFIEAPFYPTRSEAVAAWNTRIHDRLANPLPAEGVAVKALEWTHMPSYGEINWRQLQEAIAEAQFADRSQVTEADPSYYIGHQMVTGVNFNSLNRIVSAFALAALSSPLVEKAKEAGE